VAASKCDDRDEPECDLCDDRGRDCRRLEDHSSPSRETYECNPDRDRDCVCIEREDFCCDNSRRCRGDDCCVTCNEDRDDDCFCDRDDNCVEVKTSRGSGSAIERKAKKIFVDSCLKLGGTMLEVWNPDGDKRSSSQSERDFKEDLENFFNTASCTKFDRDIQDYYDGKSRDDYRRENFDRDPDSFRRRTSFKRVPLNQPQISNLSNGAAGSGVGGKVAVVTQTTNTLKSILATAAKIKEAAEGN